MDASSWKCFIFYYYVAIAMDVIDGACARLTNTVTNYGTCLDMVCDRASVSVLYFMLASVYPRLENIFMLFFLVDYAGHYMQVMANAMTQNISHKNVGKGENWLVRLYYGNKVFFVICACGADNGLVYLFINGRVELNQILVAIASTIIVTKQLINMA